MGWRFINLSDLSIAKKYVFQNNEQTADAINNDIFNIEVIKREFGGDFIMVSSQMNAAPFISIIFLRQRNSSSKHLIKY